MIQVIYTINGKVHIRIAYWSDRTIPGKWVIPK